MAVTSGRPCPEPRWRQRPMQVSLSLSVPSHDVLLLLSFGTLALWGAGLSLGNDTIVKVLLWHISGWKMFLHPTPAMEDASARSAPAAKFLYRLRYRTRLSIFQQHSGGGGGWNRRNFERQNLAQQRGATLCRGIFWSKAISLGVIVSALGMHIPLVPAQLATIRKKKDAVSMEMTLHCGRCGRTAGTWVARTDTHQHHDLVRMHQITIHLKNDPREAQHYNSTVTPPFV